MKELPPDGGCTEGCGGRSDCSPEVTGIRFFASFYVVVFHSRVGEVCLQHGWYAAGNFFQNGYLAVPLFFLLSGFILAYTYQGQIERRGDVRRFWEARFARIWPVYAVSLLFSALPPLSSAPPPKVMIATLLMVQSWNPFDISMAGAWNFVCWTLSAEAFFYLVFPGLQVWLERRSSRTQLGWIALMLLVCVAINSAAHTLGYPVMGISSHIPLAIYHVPEFFTGVGLGCCFLRRQMRTAGQSIVESLSRLGLWTYLSLGLTILLLCRPGGRWTSLVVVSFAALLFSLAAENTLLSRFLSTRTMLLGGGISYTMYLMQIVVKSWVTHLANRFHVPDSLRLPLNALVLILISWVLFKLVEDPARIFLRSAFAGIEQRRRFALARRRSTP
jgi:peptidoglycan/LPS O-acetylase OafA/YrhL